MLDRELKDKVALITGASQRLGAMTARFLHAAGANIVIHYRNSAAAAEQLQQSLLAIRANSAQIVQADLLNTEALANLLHISQQYWQRLDILVNNASSFYPTPVGNTTVQQWEDLMASNLKAPYFLSQAAAPFLAEQQGCIVNIIDIHAQRPMAKHSVYNMAKAGLAMQVKTLAYELGPTVRVNGVAPGAILWPENEMADETKNDIVSRTYLKRQGSAEDISRTVLFLVRDADYITGQIINVDGGRELFI
ncbi:MAG: pteridine reductase [Pseudomonadota bacterium]